MKPFNAPGSLRRFPPESTSALATITTCTVPHVHAYTQSPLLHGTFEDLHNQVASTRYAYNVALDRTKHKFQANPALLAAATYTPARPPCHKPYVRHAEATVRYCSATEKQNVPRHAPRKSDSTGHRQTLIPKIRGWRTWDPWCLTPANCT